MSDTTNTQETTNTTTTNEAGAAKEDAGKAERLFTQDEVDRIVARRLARAVPADYDEVKAKAQRLDEYEKNREADIEAAVKKAVDEATLALTEKHLAERVLDKIEVAASGKFADVEDARLRLRDRAADFVKDGQIDVEAITAALDEILESHPHLRAPSTPDRRQVGIGVVSKDASPSVNVSPGLGRLAFAYAQMGKAGDDK